MVTNAPPITEVFVEEVEDDGKPDLLRPVEPAEPLEAPALPVKMVSKTGPTREDSALNLLQPVDNKDPEDAQKPAFTVKAGGKPVSPPLLKPAPSTVDEEVAAEAAAINEPPKPEPAPSPRPQRDVVHKSSPAKGGNVFTGLLIFFLLILALSGWGMYFKIAYLDPAAVPPQSNANQTATPTAAPAAAEPTPATTRTEIKIEVLNGSGVPGAAAKTQQYLANLGYTVTKTGNADKSNYTTTQIIVDPNLATTELLLSDLTKEYDTASVSGQLKDGEEIDVRLILGRDWYQK